MVGDQPVPPTCPVERPDHRPGRPARETRSRSSSAAGPTSRRRSAAAAASAARRRRPRRPRRSPSSADLEPLIGLAPRLDPELAPQEARELVARREPARLAGEHLDSRARARAPATAPRTPAAPAGATRSSPWTGGQNGSATDAGWRSIRTATHSRRATDSIARTNGPIASMS